VSDASYTFIGVRYQLFPAALLLLALLVPRDLPVGAVVGMAPSPVRSWREDARTQPAVLAVVALWALVAFVPSFRLSTARSDGPEWRTGVTAAQNACAVDRASAEVVPISPPPAWAVEVPCAELRGSS
jgi:hypothetical protein